MRAILVIAVSLWLISCQSERERDSTRLEKDGAATSELNRLNTLLASNRPVTRIDVESLSRLRAEYPNSPAVRKILQGALIKREDWAAAEEIIAETPETERTNADRLNLARIFFKQGKFREATDTLKAISPAGDERVDVAALLGQAQFYSGFPDEAANSLEPVRSELIRQARADELTVLGMIYFRRGDRGKALEVLQQAVDVSPDSIPVNNALSRVYTAAGDTAKAEVYRTKLQAINEKTAAAEKRKSRLVPLFYQLEDAHAAKDFAKVIAVAEQIKPEADDATKVSLYQYLAAAYRGQGREAEAQSALAEAAKLTQK